MKKAKASSKPSSSKPAGSRRGRKPKTSEPAENTPRLKPEKLREAATLNLWATEKVYVFPDKTHGIPAYVIREMPTPVNVLSVDTLRRKIYQDIFLKYEMLRGKRVAYSPLWETHPLNIETSVIQKNPSGYLENLLSFRKQCRQTYGELLKAQQQKLEGLGIFADWSSADKTLEARYETKLFSVFDRLRDLQYLYDEPRLSHWCPKCITPLELGKTITQVTTEISHTYIKFPFNTGFEEFGVNVFFAMLLPLSQLWEIAGTIALGIREEVTYWLTKFKDDYLIFAEPQLKMFENASATRDDYPVPIAKLKTEQLVEHTVSHPLFSLTNLPFFVIPENVFDRISSFVDETEWAGSVIHLNPAHHPLSYSLLRALSAPAYSTRPQFQFGTAAQITPIFDETGRFTEDADTLCGLHLFNAEQFIHSELKLREYLIKARTRKEIQLCCQHCNTPSVFRPHQHWRFTIAESTITDELKSSGEYWNNYNKRLGAAVRKAVMAVSDMPVSSQRRWGIPLPILRCDHCNVPIIDKNILRVVRRAIRSGTEHWFRLSVEELLPTDTSCTSCHSKDFRKESTYIDNYFINLLQALDSSDFKKVSLESPVSVVFAPRRPFLKWLAELSVLAATLRLSRPIKECHPFKRLQLNNIEEKVWQTEIPDAMLQKYPADVLRLTVIAPDLHQVKSKVDGTAQLETLAKKHKRKYTQLKEILHEAARLRAHFRSEASTDAPDEKTSALLHPDTLAVSITNQLLEDVAAAYRKSDFYGIWTRLFDFCRADLQCYIHLCQQIDGSDKRFTSAKIAFEAISNVLLQCLAPLFPFLAEEIHQDMTNVPASVFLNTRNQLPSVPEQDDAKSEWRALKNAYRSKT